MIKFVFSILIILLITSSCGINRSSLKKDIVRLKSEEIKFPDKMLKYIPNKQHFNNDGNVIVESTKKLSWIIYVDSTECSTCAYGLVYKWEAFLRKYQENVDFNFIFTPRQSESHLTLIALKQVHYEHFIWIDEKGEFEKSNPHLPKSKLLHTFLLDENNNVILVGNPLLSKKVQGIFYKIVEEKSKIQ